MKPLRGETSAIGTLITFILLIVALGILWIYTGGPERSSGLDSPFLSMPNVPGVAIVPPSGTSGSVSAPTTKPRTVRDYFYDFSSGYVGSTEVSPYAKYVSLHLGEPKNTNPRSEYLVIKTSKSAESAVTMTGWSLVGSNGIVAKIGSAAHIPFLGQVNVELPVTASPASTVYVTTGRSPNGTSFRTNKCTGYFEQFQNFYPTLKFECPRPTDEMLKFPEGIAGNRTCLDYIEDIPQCHFSTEALPGNIGGLCQEFILNQLSYSGCVTNHKNDAGFYKNEWRIFLNRDQELWQSKYEHIRLLDENGRIIDELSY